MKELKNDTRTQVDSLMMHKSRSQNRQIAVKKRNNFTAINHQLEHKIKATAA